MKKFISTFLVFTVVTLSLLLPTYAETLNQAQTSGSMEINTTRMEEIEVSFPADISVPWNTQGNFDIGEISAEKIVISPTKKVVITVASQNNLKFLSDGGEIPYTLGGADSIEFAETNVLSAYPLTVSVLQADWDKAPAGEYGDVLTFTLEYVNK